MARKLEAEWLQGTASLGTATTWAVEEVRLIAELGYALAELERTEEALVVFEGLAALSPSTPYFQAALGALKLRLSKPEEAIGYLDAAIAANASDVASLVNRAEAYLTLGKRDRALLDLRAALRQDTHLQPDNPSLVRARALLARYG
ncbi:MAG: type III secretion protein [Blastocatellia bacterium]